MTARERLRALLDGARAGRPVGLDDYAVAKVAALDEAAVEAPPARPRLKLVGGGVVLLG